MWTKAAILAQTVLAELMVTSLKLKTRSGRCLKGVRVRNTFFWQVKWFAYQCQKIGPTEILELLEMLFVLFIKVFIWN